MSVKDNNRIISKDEVLGRKLTAIMQTSDVVDDWICVASHYFVLDNGVSFYFPCGPELELKTGEIPEGAQKIPENDALGSTIENVYRFNDDYLESDGIYLKTSSGHWISQSMSAPLGVHNSVGLYIDKEPPDDFATDYIDFWAETSET